MALAHPDKAVPSPRSLPRRLVVVMPTWLGDCVMATPTLRALRELFPQAHIAALCRANVLPVLEGLPWVGQFITMEKEGSPGPRPNLFAIAKRLAKEKFDAAVLLPNSFRSAAIVSMAGIPRRIGYDRDGRGFMLTDRLIPRRHNGQYLPVPTLTYYLGIARYLGSAEPSAAMELATDPADDRAAAEALARGGCDLDAGDRLLLLNPGAQKLEKRWAPDRFAATADRLAHDHGLKVAVTGSPAERAVLDRVIADAGVPVIDLPAAGIALRQLKSVIRHARLLITNDTGPRHIAAALGTDVVTLFGPTTPDWTEIGFARERVVQSPTTPGSSPGSFPGSFPSGSDARAMSGVTVNAVVAAAHDLLSTSAANTSTTPAAATASEPCADG